MAGHNVFLVPCDPENYDRTVRSPVDLTEYPDRPEPFSEMETARFWGAREGKGNRTYFEKMREGDLVLFYQKQQYIGVGFVGITFEDYRGWVRTTFWRDAPSQLIYTIEEFSPVAVPREKTNAIFDYANEYYPQGLTRVVDDRVTKRISSIRLAIEEVSKRD